VNVNLLIKTLIFGVFVLLFSSYFIAKNKGVQSFEKTQLLTEFDASLVEVIKMQTAKNDDLMSVKKVNGQWLLSNKFDYPVDTAQLSKLLQSLKDAKIIELKTKQDKYFSRLGLQNIDKPTSVATLLTFESKEQSIQVLLGNESTSASGRYVRLAGSSQTYLVDLDIDLPEASSDWLKPDIVPIEYAQIRQVDITLPENSFSIVRKESDDESADITVTDELTVLSEENDKVRLKDNFELVETVEGKKLQYDSILTGLVRNIINLTVKDVQLGESHQMPVYQTLILNYVDKAAHQALPNQQMSLKLFKTDDETPTYWLQKNNDKWLLQISEFDFKQVSKPLNDYLE